MGLDLKHQKLSEENAVVHYCCPTVRQGFMSVMVRMAYILLNCKGAIAKNGGREDEIDKAFL